MVEILCFLASGTLRLVAPKVDLMRAKAFPTFFQRAWECLPVQDRLDLERYWQARTAPTAFKDRWQGLRDHQLCVALGTGSGLPVCSQAGHLLLFSVDVLDEMGDALTVQAITHELAHAVLYMRGDADHWGEPKTPEMYKGA